MWSHGMLAGEPETGDVEAISAQAADLQARGEALREQAVLARQAGATLAEMDGQAVTAQADQLVRTAGRLDRVADGDLEASQILGSYVDELSAIAAMARGLRASVEELTGRAEWCRQAVCASSPQAAAVAWSWQTLPPASSVDGSGYEYTLWSAALDEIAQLRVDWQRLVERREHLDTDTAARLRQIEVVAEIDQAVPAVAVGQAGALAAALWAGGHNVSASMLASAGSAGAVRAVWDQLTPAQRAALVRASPRTIGNLDGVPLKYRAQANRAHIRTEITSMRDQIAALDAEIAAGATSRSTVLYELTERRAELAELMATYENYLDVPDDRYVLDQERSRQVASQREIVLFDPPAVATYHGVFDDNGDIPAWMANVAVHVPGTTTNIHSFPATDQRAFDLYRRANEADRTAMIAWAGGELPQHVDAAWDGYTRDLAPKLRDFTAAIDTHSESSTLTVTGHSYGGAVVGMAEHQGLRADRILYVSSAGMGNDVDGLADYPHTADVPHYALMARNDAIVGLVQGADTASLGHGASPLNTDGVVRLETGWLDESDPSAGSIEDLGPTASHSGVYKLESTSFENIVSVITGGEATQWAPNKVTHTPAGPIVEDGIDAADYTPTYLSVE